MLYKNILITGGAGFIGSHLVKRLVKKDVKLNLIIKATTKTSRLTDVFSSINFYEADLTDENKIKLLINKIQPDIIFHLAARGINFENSSVNQMLETNIKGTHILMRSLQGSNCKKFINTGSCFEYDGNSNKPYDEEMQSCPSNYYGLTKQTANRLVKMNAENLKITAITIRPFGLYGEDENTTRLIPTIILKALDDKPINLTPGKQIRDYIYIEDLIDAYIQAAEWTAPNLYEEFNIGSGIGISIKKLAEMIINQLNKKYSLLKIGALPYREKEMMSLVADTTKTHRLLSWKPITSLEQGLKQLINWYYENRN